MPVCRFGYGFYNLTLDATHGKLVCAEPSLTIDKRQGLRYNPPRNNRRLNPAPRDLFEAWGANMDFSFLMLPDKPLEDEFDLLCLMIGGFQGLTHEGMVASIINYVVGKHLHLHTKLIRMVYFPPSTFIYVFIV